MKRIYTLAILLSILGAVLMTTAHAPNWVAMAARTVVSNTGEPAESELIGPPWFDEAWNYRMPVVINSSSALSWYQVLVSLNNANFNFNRAKPDGSDIRFTHSDGTTELKHWIESWDSIEEQQAYIWVKVPGIADGITTIYLYYNNPDAISNSDGISTFDSFDDDWFQFTGIEANQVEKAQKPGLPDGTNSPFNWSTIIGNPVVSPAGILNLGEGTGIKSTATYQNQAVGFLANFDTDLPHELNGREWGGFINGASGKRTIIGDLPSDWDDLYLRNENTAPDIDRLLQRVGGDPWHNAFHLYEVKWNGVVGISVGEIDHGASSASSTSQVPGTALPVTLYSYMDSNTTLVVDWIYIRQYHFPEPVATPGDEQGLVEIGIQDIDTPDPLPKGKRLTYQLTISNTSIIEAPGVVVTDTLPLNVEIGPVNSSRGSCQAGLVILCNMDIPANSMAQVSIVVTPTIDGVITNTVVVGSPGFEIDLSDNYSEEVTLVDSIPPTVNWEKPVQNSQTYHTFGGIVTLEASATDNDQVASVEFKYWDHIDPPHWVFIGMDNTYPYQVPFNMDVLEPNQIYQTFVIGVDRAGNRSNPANPPRVIYIVREQSVFLPLMKK